MGRSYLWSLGDRLEVLTPCPDTVPVDDPVRLSHAAHVSRRLLILHPSQHKEEEIVRKVFAPPIVHAVDERVGEKIAKAVTFHCRAKGKMDDFRTRDDAQTASPAHGVVNHQVLRDRIYEYAGEDVQVDRTYVIPAISIPVGPWAQGGP